MLVSKRTSRLKTHLRLNNIPPQKWSGLEEQMSWGGRAGREGVSCPLLTTRGSAVGSQDGHLESLPRTLHSQNSLETLQGARDEAKGEVLESEVAGVSPGSEAALGQPWLVFLGAAQRFKNI